jgi:hypothetical protein
MFQPRSPKLADLWIVICFGFIAFWLIGIPHVKNSGLVPSLNHKIKRVLYEKDYMVSVELHSYHYPNINTTDLNFPLNYHIDNSISFLIKDILKNGSVNDGFRRFGEVTYFIIDVYDDKKLISIELSWDSIREIMEVRFYDTKGNSKRDYYKIDKNLAKQLFAYIKPI